MGCLLPIATEFIFHFQTGFVDEDKKDKKVK